MIKKHLATMYERAHGLNDQYVLQAIKESGPAKVLLDVGCWDGKLTLEYAKALRAKECLGIELVPEAAKLAKKNGIECSAIRADADPWPYADSSIDCVV